MRLESFSTVMQLESLMISIIITMEGHLIIFHILSILLKSGEFGVTKLGATPRPCQGRDFP